jgi:hypothetical protein
LNAAAHACLSALCRGAFEEALQEGMGEGHSYEEVVNWSKTKVLLRQSSNWLIILQVRVCVGDGGGGQFGPV